MCDKCGSADEGGFVQRVATRGTAYISHICVHPLVSKDSNKKTSAIGQITSFIQHNYLKAS